MMLLYTTHSSKAEAQKITDMLLEAKLIACANYFPIEACLIWEGSKTTESEIVALYKTSDAKASEAETAITKHHLYKIPCIIKIKSAANESYENWVNETVTQ